MKTTLAIAIALAASVGTSAYAQLVKQDTITLALTLQAQSSVSTSATAINAGNFSQGPLYYKTSSSKFTQVNVIEAIAIVLHKNANFYTSQATLELVQGEMGGFWNITDPLAQSFPEYGDLYWDGRTRENWLNGSFNNDGFVDFNPYIYYQTNLFNGQLPGPWFPDSEGSNGPPAGNYPDVYGYDPGADPLNNGYDIPAEYFDSYIPNVTDLYDRTSIADGNDEYAQLDTGRHFLPVPWESYNTGSGTGVPYATTGQYPVGHMQPWGQVYIKDPGHKDSSGNPLCENVTFFFDFEVEECYDCFYLSSFITDATFKNNSGTQSGPPCCTSPGYLTGKGTDHYYLSLDFDNTVNNSYLNSATNDIGDFYYGFVGFTGLTPTAGVADGLTPDLLQYSDAIRSHLGTSSPYETRFSLHGLVTYNWTLKFINASDVAPDYIGTATYSANGYGFVGLICDLLTGTATFTETAVKDIGCCDDERWYYQEYNTPGYNGQADYGTTVIGWYGPGWDGGYGYYNPDLDQYNPYPYYDILAGDTYLGPPDYLEDTQLPYQFESPYNPPAALTRHALDDGSSSIGNESNSDLDNDGDNYEYYFIEECAP